MGIALSCGFMTPILAWISLFSTLLTSWVAVADFDLSIPYLVQKGEIFTMKTAKKFPVVILIQVKTGENTCNILVQYILNFYKYKIYQILIFFICIQMDSVLCVCVCVFIAIIIKEEEVMI